MSVVAVRRAAAVHQEALDQSLDDDSAHAHLQQNQLDHSEQVGAVLEDILVYIGMISAIIDYFEYWERAKVKIDAENTDRGLT